MAGTPGYMAKSLPRGLCRRNVLKKLYGDEGQIRHLPDASDPTTKNASSRTVDVFPAARMSSRTIVMMRSAMG